MVSTTQLAAEADAMKRYAIAITGDLGEAEDLVQDCMERALRKWSLRGDTVPLRPWLFRMMRNLHISRWRKSRRHRQTASLDDLTSPPELAARQDDQVDLNRLLARVMTLPEDQRNALFLVSVEGFTYAEAARALGVPEGTIMSRISRARTVLRRTDNLPGRPALRRVK